MTILRKSRLDATAISLLLVCCLFWGFQQVLVKVTLAEVPPVFQAALRFGVATLALLLWCSWRGLPVITPRALLKPALLAGAMFTLEFVGIYVGLQYTGASRLTLFLYTSPFWVALLLPLITGTEKLGPLQWLGFVCAFAAVAFALREGFAQATGLQWLGDLLGLAGGMFWGLTTVAIRTTTLSRATPEQQLFCQLLFSALALPLLSLGLGETWSFQLSHFALLSLLLQALVGAFASYLAWMWMLARYPATQMSVFVFLTPVIALVVGAGWQGEGFSAGLVVALALVVVGIVLVNRKPS